MRLIVDAQLPRHVVLWLAPAGHDVIHTLDLPRGNRTPDAEITSLADAEDRIVVTKDADFVDSHTVRGRPAKLLLISTGNASNAALSALLARSLPAIAEAFELHSFVELDWSGLNIRA